MKLSNTCIIGLVGGILLCLNIVINFVALMTSEYITLDALSIFLWILSFAGWAMMLTFFILMFQNCKKLDRILRDM